MVGVVAKPSGEGGDKEEEAKRPHNADPTVAALDSKRGGKKKKPNTHTMLIRQLPLWIVRVTKKKEPNAHTMLI